jgi:hypothetical protein
MPFFKFANSEYRKEEQILPRGLVPVGWSSIWGKGMGGWIWCKYCVYLYVNGKNDTCCNGIREIKENGGGVNTPMMYLIYCRTIC